tara:strand:- start:503 stop:745 length:243 start_codon:yes stop_codon:yes gene_type:complete
MAKATRKTYEALTQLYVDRDMEVQLSDYELLKSLSIDFDEFKDYVRASNIRHKQNVARWVKFMREDEERLREYAKAEEVK